MKKISKFAAALSVVPVLAFASPALAVSPGQLAGGDNYQVKNLTQNGAYANSISATCNEEVKYSMQLSNTEFGSLDNVTLKVTFPSNGGQSVATATTSLGGTSGTSDSATVNLGDGQTIAIENGSTMLFDDSGNAIKTLSDGIATSGVNIGTLKGSTTEFVNFKAKVNCPTPPVTPPVTPPATPVTPTAAPTPTALPNTGAGEVAAVFTGASALGTAAHMVVSRRNRR